MATTAPIPRPTSARAATRGRETPPVSVSFCGALAEALAIGLMEALIEALDEDVVPPPPPPDTLTLAVISGCIEQW